MKHILNQCSQSGLIWDMAIQIMHRSNKNKLGIVNTIENWDSITYQSPILDHILKLLQYSQSRKSGKRETKESSTPLPLPPTTWEKILTLIQETIRAKPWTHNDMQ